MPMPDRPPTRSPLSGGPFLAIGAIGGAAAGLPSGNTTLGLLAGFAIGTVIAVVIWLRGR